MSDGARLINSGDPEATTCVEPEFAGRDDGLPNLLRAYGVTRPYSRPPQVTTLDTGVVYQATANGNPCRFGEVFTTDGRLPGLDLVTLVDDREFFPIYNASAEIRTAVLQRDPAAGTLLEDVAQRLTDPVILQLNGQISSEGRDPGVVAREWLQGQGLVT